MKNFAKLFLILALFTSAAVAEEGHTGTGNRACTIDCPAPCTDNCTDGNGTTTSAETGAVEDESSNESEESFVEYYFTSLWEMFNNGL